MELILIFEKLMSFEHAIIQVNDTLNKYCYFKQNK